MSPRSSRKQRRARSQRGVTLAEMLAVVALMGILVAAAVPLINEQVRQAKIRGAADQYATTLKAARMLAVSKRQARAVDVQVDPVNRYSYVDTREVTRTFDMPDGVRIVSSTDPITFQINGSLASAATTVIEADLTSGVKERWTVTTGVEGVASVERERVEP